MERGGTGCGVSWHRGGGARGLEGGGGGDSADKAGARGVVARPLETLMGEKPEWRKSNPGREEAGVASRWWLSRGKSECGFLT